MESRLFNICIAVIVFISTADGSGLPHLIKLNHVQGNCSQLKVYHRGFRVAQTEGPVLLNQEKKPDSESTVSTDTNSTSIESVSNSTCVVPKFSDGKQYNWWQVLLQSGGKPGTLKELKRKTTSETEHYVNPCERPLTVKDKDEFVAYEYKNSDFKTFYREEIAHRRFPDTLQSFLEVSGKLVWVPPQEVLDKRGYNINYNVDDTGLWVVVWDDDCSFSQESNETTLECSAIPTCECYGEDLVCDVPISLNGNLVASLVG